MKFTNKAIEMLFNMYAQGSTPELNKKRLELLNLGQNICHTDITAEDIANLFRYPDDRMNEIITLGIQDLQSVSENTLIAV